MENLLTKIEQNTSNATAAFLICSGHGSEIYTRFKEPIILKEEDSYSIALTGLQTYNSIPNLEKDINDSLTFYDPQSESWMTIHFETGSYSLDDLNDKVQQLTPIRGAILIWGDYTSLKACVKIKTGYKIEFKEGDISTLLGFDPQILGPGTHSGNSIVNILSVNSINVSLDIIAGGFLNGEQKNIVYSFFPRAQIGSKIIETPLNLLFLPLLVKRISEMRITLRDQEDNLINLRSEAVTVQFEIRRT